MKKRAEDGPASEAERPALGAIPEVKVTPPLRDLREDELYAELRARAGAMTGGTAPIVQYEKAREELKGYAPGDIFRELRDRQGKTYKSGERRDVCEIDPVTGAGVLENVRAVALVVGKEELSRNGASYALDTYVLGPTFDLCTEQDVGAELAEPYRDQPCAGIGTAFLVEPRILVTARHCLPRDDSGALDLASVAFVFDFAMGPEEADPGLPAAEAVVSAVGVQIDGGDADWVRLVLEREMIGRAPLRISGAVGAQVYILGHPCGLPMKYAGPAAVMANLPAEPHFFATLDAYGGNSGSPVFNLEHEVVGMLVRGEPDFVRVPASLRDSKVSCFVSLVIPRADTESRCVAGEMCVRAALFRRAPGAA